ncbi:hypothetical protein ACKWTF_012266 [Chironomus riparius]
MIPRKVFVGSLPQGSKPEELRRLFEKYGVVTECDILNRCGFVHMATSEQADAAIKALNNVLFNGVNIVVERGRMKPQGSLGSGSNRGGQMGGNNRNNGPQGIRGGNSRGNGAFRANNMSGGMNQQQMGGPMRQNRQNDRQQSRNTPYSKNQRGGGAGRSFQQRDNNPMGGNNNSNHNMGRFDNNMQMDNRQGMNNFDRGMSNNNMMDRNRSGFNDDNNFNFSEDRRGFALPSYSNDISQNNFGNDRQNNSMGNMGNRRNSGAPPFMTGQSFERRNQNMGNSSGVGNKFQNNDMFTRRSGQQGSTGVNRNQNNTNNFESGNFGNFGANRRKLFNL